MQTQIPSSLTRELKHASMLCNLTNMSGQTLRSNQKEK